MSFEAPAHARLSRRPRPGIVALGVSLCMSVCLLAGGGCPQKGGNGPKPPVPMPESQDLGVAIVATFPHDTRAFTQGLLLHGGVLYESTGNVGQSSLRRVDPASGRVEAEVAVPAPYFAEGLAQVGDRLIQLTWRNQRAFVWRMADFEKLGEHSYDGEGWGLCHDGKRLVMSDGSARLTFRDPETFAVQGGVDVARDGQPVRLLNELECVGDAVFANVWQRDVIVRIDPESGAVTAWIDASGLLTADERRGADVLNGIAYVPERGTFLITGKYWPRMFEVRFVPRKSPAADVTEYP